MQGLGPLTWRWCWFAELSVSELHDALMLRQRVFVVEQACVYADADLLDRAALHGQVRDRGALVAYARIIPPGPARPLPVIGRVVVAPEARRTGLGRALMIAALAEVHARYPGQAVSIRAQAHLQGFYGSLGFVAQGVPYDDDGIPHIDMLRQAGPPAG